MSTVHDLNTSSSLKVLNASTHPRMYTSYNQNEKNYLRSTCQPKIDHSNNYTNLVSSVHKTSKEILTCRNDDVESLMKENQSLRQQVSYLKNCLNLKQNTDSNNKSQLFAKISKLQDEKDNLKRIIQKSYNYIKQMESQSQRMIKQLKQNLLYNQMKQKRVKILQFENQSLKNKLKKRDFAHQQQVKELRSRVDFAEERVSQLMNLMQKDQRQWIQQKDEIVRFKKLYINSNINGNINNNNINSYTNYNNKQ